MENKKRGLELKNTPSSFLSFTRKKHIPLRKNIYLKGEINYEKLYEQTDDLGKLPQTFGDLRRIWCPVLAGLVRSHVHGSA
jgi:hypothetical protein